MASAKNVVGWLESLGLTELFWIGGTKNGALLGEAVVIKDASLAADFGYLVNQNGCLLAKSRVMGAQFAALFEDEDDLFSKLASDAKYMTLVERLDRLGRQDSEEFENATIHFVTS